MHHFCTLPYTFSALPLVVECLKEPFKPNSLPSHRGQAFPLAFTKHRSRSDLATWKRSRLKTDPKMKSKKPKTGPLSSGFGGCLAQSLPPLALAHDLDLAPRQHGFPQPRTRNTERETRNLGPRATLNVKLETSNVAKPFGGCLSQQQTARRSYSTGATAQVASRAVRPLGRCRSRKVTTNN